MVASESHRELQVADSEESIPNKSYFSFCQWYPLFQNHTFKSIVIPLPKEFLDYLTQDGISIKKQE
jgi:hypothetical protein